MRIAILTLPLHTNYGGILQAYALQTVLERMGHKVDVLDKKRRIKTQLPTSVKIKRFILKNILFQDIAPLGEDVAYKRRKFENKHTWKFADKYINRREISSFEEIKEGEYDAIVVGSDQVWRPCYFTGNYNTPMQTAFLDFTQNWNIKRISYAASFGSDFWEFKNDETKYCSKLINKFNAVSVREKSAKELLEKHLNFTNVDVVPDPTFLLEKENYIKLFKNSKTPKSKGNLLVYFIDETEDKNNLIDIIATTKGLKPFKVNSKVEGNKNRQENTIYTQPSVESWLRGFYDADFIVTDSFHACVFSIIFKKEFIVYANEERGLARFKHLLELFGLEDRYIVNSSEFDTLNITSSIQTIGNISVYKNIGITYLKENLV